MVAPPLFGWSAGDVISGAQALYTIGRAFSDTHGAEKQYALASEVLKNLALDIQQARERISSSPASRYVPNIRAKLQIIEAAYAAFENHQDDYKELRTTLTATKDKKRHLVKKQAKKIGWAIEQMNGKLKILKDAVMEPLGSINACYLHMTLDDLATLREAALHHNVELMQLEMSLGRGAEQHRTELVSAQASLTDLHTQLESQEQAVKDTLAGLESTLARIEEQTKALNVMRGNLDSVSVFASAQLQETTRIRNCLAEDSKRLSVEIENFNVSQESTSKLLSSAIDKISKIEKITEKLEARGRRTEMAAVLAAGSVFALLAKNILTLSKPVIRTDTTVVPAQLLQDNDELDRHAPKKSPLSPSLVYRHRNPSTASTMQTKPRPWSHMTFCFTYKHIKVRPHISLPNYKRTSLSCPPMTTEYFETTPSSPVKAWSPGLVRPLDEQAKNHLSTLNTSSMIWCEDHQTYLTVPYDCSTINVLDRVKDDELDNWERLRFGHDVLALPNGNRSVSVVGHRYPNDDLAATGPSSWMPQLIPNAHQCQKPVSSDTTGQSFLAGDLSILLGLIALSTTADRIRDTVKECFRPDPDSTEWRTHSHESFGSTMIRIHVSADADLQAGKPGYGIIMTILYDSDYMTAEDLHDWETGVSSLGPILS